MDAGASWTLIVSQCYVEVDVNGVMSTILVPGGRLVTKLEMQSSKEWLQKRKVS